ncbi:MAG TPA: dihydrolipoyllysine-residue acetyltransferase [Casimicrobiaceae bacterium]
MLEVKVPDIGDFKDVPVIEVLVKPGDAVSAEQSLVTLESDKATLEVPSPSSGVVQSVAVKVGDKVSEGSVLLALDAKSPAKAAGTSAKPSAASAAAPVATPAAPREAPPAAGKPASARNGNGLARHDAVNLGDARGRGDLAGEGPSGNPPPVSSTEIRVPDIGDFDSVPVIEVFVKPGDILKVDDPIVTLESNKATMDVPSPIAGVVQGVRVAVGDKVREGTVLCTMSAVDTAIGAPPAARAPAPGSRAPDAAAPATANKTAAAPLAPTANASAAPAAAAPAPAATSAASATPAAAVDSAAFRRAHASPSVRLFARELGVDLGKVRGTGPHDRILREDVQAFVKTTLAAPAPTAAPAARTGGLEVLPWPQIDFSKFGAIESKPLSRIKKIAGANLARNWVMIPHVTQFDDADITDLEALRVALNKEYEKSGPKVTMLAFLIKASVAALARFSDFNASLVSKTGGDELVLKKYFNIGFAADTPNGLVVPVIRNADQKGVLAIAKEMGELSVKAREGKLTPGEMQGGCFSISSLGGIGGTAFTPIINAPEVAILGVSKSVMKPVWDGKAFAPRLTLPLSLSYDHRVIDGAAAARFTSYLASLLGDMRRSLL